MDCLVGASRRQSIFMRIYYTSISWHIKPSSVTHAELYADPWLIPFNINAQHLLHPPSIICIAGVTPGLSLF